MIEYSLSGKKYVLDYQDLKEKYNYFISLSNKDFLLDINNALHFACIVCFLKGYGNNVLGDDGIIHEMVHLLSIGDEPMVNIEEIRMEFNEKLKIS
jgi:hypothetical protein